MATEPIQKLQAITDFIRNFDREVEAADVSRYTQLLEEHLMNLHENVLEAQTILESIGEVEVAADGSTRTNVNRVIQKVNDVNVHAIETVVARSKESEEGGSVLAAALVYLRQLQGMLNEFQAGDDTAFRDRKFRVEGTDTDMMPGGG